MLFSRQVPALSISLLLLSFSVWGQSSKEDTLRVVNWNLEFFGDTPSQLPEEMVKTKTIMDSLDADIYALQEVVNIDSLSSLVLSLNGNYDFVVSPYGSLAPNPYGSQYASAQKLAFVYRTSMVRNVKTRALLKNSLFASDYWSSGRLPFLVNAEVLGRDKQWRAFDFVVIHAKAKSDNSSCNRRYAGYLELKDSLDTYFFSSRIVLLGDFNDDADVSICSGLSQSTFWSFVADSSGPNYYNTVTLPLSRAGISSIYGYPNFLDHVIISDEVVPYYVVGSAEMLKDKVTNWVTGYTQYVSDHYPVMTKYVLDETLNTQEQSHPTVTVYPNPAKNYLRLVATPGRFDHYIIMDASGHQVKYGTIAEHETTVYVADLPPAIYFVKVWGDKSTLVTTLVITP